MNERIHIIKQRRYELAMAHHICDDEFNKRMDRDDEKGQAHSLHDLPSHMTNCYHIAPFCHMYTNNALSHKFANFRQYMLQHKSIFPAFNKIFT